MTSVERPQRWWQPFPPYADRPWRSVFVRVDHDVRVNLRSPGRVVWMAITLPFLLTAVGAVRSEARFRSRDALVLVVEDPGVRAAYATHAEGLVHVVATAPPTLHGVMALVHVRGQDALHPTLDAQAASKSERAIAERLTLDLVRQVRHAAVQADLDLDLHPTTHAPPSGPGTATQPGADGAPHFLAAAAYLGWIVGIVFGNAAQARASEDLDIGADAVLQVGTPPSVLWLGTTLAWAARILSVTLAWASLLALALLGLVAAGGRAEAISTVATIGTLVLTTFAIGAGSGLVLTAGIVSAAQLAVYLFSYTWRALRQLQAVPYALAVAYAVLVWRIGASWWWILGVPLPFVGLASAALAIEGDASWAWYPVALGVQLLWAVAGAVAGARTHGAWEAAARWQWSRLDADGEAP